MVTEAERQGNSLKWQDDSAMKSKFQRAYTTYNGWLVGGRQAEISDADGGLSISDGSFSWFGGLLPGGDASKPRNISSAPDVGVFAQVLDSTDDYVKIYKSQYASEDFVKVLDLTNCTPQPLAHGFIDCGMHDIAATPTRILLFATYNKDGDYAQIFVSKSTSNATAGDTWTNLFLTALTCPAIRHFHGGKYIKGKGLYIFTGDSDEQSSILFCPEDEIPDLVDGSTGAAAFHATKWLLGTGDRSGWSGDVKTDHILLGNTQLSRTVEFVTPDSKVAYWIPDRAPDVGGNSIMKVDFFDTTDSDAGTITVIKDEGVKNTGWFGGASKNGMVYFSTLTNWDLDSHDWKTGLNDGNCDIWAIDSEDDTYALVKSIPRQDYDAARGIEPVTVAGGFVGPLVEYGGAMWGNLFGYQFNITDMGDAYSPDPSICGFVPKQKKETANVLVNGSFANGIDDWSVYITNNNLYYGAETPTFTVGETVTGSLSGATGEVLSQESDHINLVNTSIVGIFQSGETITGGSSSETATLGGFMTTEIIVDPTGQLGGNVMRIVMKSATGGYVPLIKPTLSAAVIESLQNKFNTFSCKVYFDDSTDDGLIIDTRITIAAKPGDQVWYRNGKYPFIKSRWNNMSISGLVGKGSSVNQFQFYPDKSNTDGNYVLLYVTDFQLITGAVANDEIEQLSLDERNGGYRGRYR